MSKKNITADIPILMYHQFVENISEGGKIKLFITKKKFQWQLRILKFLGYETITFKDLEKIGLENRNKKKYIILTVDDGYKDNYSILFPLLKKYNMKAVIYLVSGIDYNKWTIESDQEKRFQLLDLKEIKEMQESGLVEFGGHTLTHPSLPTLSDEALYKEIMEDKTILEKKLGENLTSFAYPYGHITPRVKEIVKNAGYKFAVSTDTGTGIIEDDIFDIRRTAIDTGDLINFLKRISPKYLHYKYKKYGNKKFEDKK
ncbi:polysaccharide deacetylase family protein [Candidatus Cetobacterium colombiensis]|uniref:Polysaccharide deacetylase family protein n=1 Tax=Candidatus Cetobacterium colombiensis TaxID=3073100 RepID=A0ABU4W8T4_9FUSO|nr:polysaccharide deacetylase family protein [Candidatus Cetobacterium colombiensis]MDX8335923.1 polysaccharide deacetylase family protein [Candidatus Cetobacterium colombiensis]